MRVMSALGADTFINASKSIKDQPLVHLEPKHHLEANTLALKHFSILKKCQNKLDCLIYDWDVFFY